MEYRKLTADHQKQMLEQRLATLEAEHYNHAVNLRLLAASGDDSDEVADAVDAAKEAMRIIEEAHGNASRILDELKAKSPDPKPAPAPNRRARRAQP